MFAESLSPAQKPNDPVSEPAAAADRIGRRAIRALYREVALAPKPGLVSPVDSGSHADMNFTTFIRSLNALRCYFPDIARQGMAGPAYAHLQPYGIAAEQRMLRATAGINTHRGAIFNLGLLCAAAGAQWASEGACTAERACRLVADRWGKDILASAGAAGNSHGARVHRRYGSGGARAEAAAGFPSAIDIGLPAYRDALSATQSPQKAALQCFFALMAELEDTNLLWRGGRQGLLFARQAAAAFLAHGGVHAADWEARVQAMHAEFIERRLSPGGAADLLGVVLFLEALR